MAIGDANSAAMGTGLRWNDGKVPFYMIPFHLLAGAARVFHKVTTRAVKPYPKWNWAKGMPWSEAYACLMRHMTAWYRGEDRDLETGESHLDHAMCNLLMLKHYEEAYTDGDDRPKFFSPRPSAGNPRLPITNDGLEKLAADGNTLARQLLESRRIQDAKPPRAPSICDSPYELDPMRHYFDALKTPIDPLDEYMKFVVANWSKKPEHDDYRDSLAIAGLGLGGESGEVTEHIKKFLRGSCDTLNVDEVKLELGDVLYYWFKICHLAGLNPRDVIEANKEKLKKRREKYAQEIVAEVSNPAPVLDMGRDRSYGAGLYGGARAS